MAGDKENDSQRVLTYAQVCHLQQIVGNEFRISGRGNNPTLTMTARELIEAVRDRVNRVGVSIQDIRINGSAASCIVSGDPLRTYNDLDVLFSLAAPLDGRREDDHTRHDRIRTAALSALMDFFPYEVNTDCITTELLSEAYAHKMVKIDNSVDRWSLISLHNHSGRNIELKFVDSMKRQYQFSIDSFQVVLDSFLFYRVASRIEMNEHFYPTVVAQTFYGRYEDALEHLRDSLIATNNPEEIRGGGLLKYCSLLASGYKPATGVDTASLEKYMCARFFIDFPNMTLQRIQLENYLANHFVGCDDQKGLFLVLVLNVVQRSAFCLPAHERLQTLNVIHQMALSATFEPELRACNKQKEMMSFDRQQTRSPGSVSFPLASCPLMASVPTTITIPGNFRSKMYGPIFAYPVYYSNPVIIPTMRRTLA